MRSPSCWISASLRSSLTTRPRTPSSAISRFEPEPTTLTGASPRRAHASSSAAGRSLPARAKYSASPPVRTVDMRSSGKSRCTIDGSSRRVPRRGPAAPSLAHPPALRPSASTSPAPITTHTSSSLEQPSKTGSASAKLGSQYTGSPAGRVGRRLGDQQPAHARDDPPRARARDRRRARPRRRPAPAPRRTRARAAPCASTGAAGTPPPGARARACALARRVAATSVGWWA